jgi:glycosyltransferase involved in cell wall biosynthesis
MKVWILQTGEPVHIDRGNHRAMRAINLCDALTARGHEVTLWTSDFNHFTKSHRYGRETHIQYSRSLTLKLIPSSGYKSNIGVQRLLDHAQLGWNLKRMMKEVSIPDIAFIGYPPIEPAWVMSRYLTAKGIPMVLDVKDAWPDVLLRGFPAKLRFFARIALMPYFKMMKDTFKKASYLSSISPEFLKWAQNIASRSPRELDKVNFLASSKVNISESELSDASEFLDSANIIDDGRFRVSYIGSLTNTLNIEPVIQAARNLDIQIVIAGDGSAASNIKEKAHGHPNIVFTGWVSTAQAAVLAKRSTLLLAPYADLADFELSLPNKFLDAFAHGKPIISSIDGYSRRFIEKEKVGFFYSNKIPGSLTKLLHSLQDNQDLIQTCSIAAGTLYEKTLSGELVYKALAQNLEDIFELRK